MTSEHHHLKRLKKSTEDEEAEDNISSWFHRCEEAIILTASDEQEIKRQEWSLTLIHSNQSVDIRSACKIPKMIKRALPLGQVISDLKSKQELFPLHDRYRLTSKHAGAFK